MYRIVFSSTIIINTRRVNSIMKQENYHFKLLSAVAILAVVAGHCINTGGIGIFASWFRAYSFHLPLFMFISGYFYKKVGKGEFPSYVIKKVKRLIVPLIFYNIIYGIVCMILFSQGFSIGRMISVETFFIRPLYNQHQYAFNCPAWFLIPLFVCYMIYPAIDRWSYNSKKKGIVIFLISIIFFVITFEYDKKGNIKYEELKIFLSRTLLLFPFFIFGRLFHLYIEKMIEKIDNKKLITISLFIEFVLIYVAKNHSIVYSICWQNDFLNKNPFIIFIASINGILFFYFLTKVCVPYIPKKLYLPLANNTYDIMMHHIFGFFCFNTLLALLSKRSEFGFNWIQYKTNVYYQYSPFFEFNILYVISGIAISLLFVFLKNNIRKKMYNYKSL